MKKVVLIWFMILVALGSNAQYKVVGRIIGAVDKKPIALASVFFSNTSKGTTTNEFGEFVLENIADGKYDLVVSFVGYETKVLSVQPSKITAPLSIELKPKANELQEVVVGGYVIEDWKRWGKFFLDNFIGQSSYAADCIIRNPESIQFRNYKKQHIVKAFSDETLIIENKALGYTIHYRLELFQYDFNSHVLFYQGYPLFEEIETKRSKKQEKWAEKRETVYYGSELHFMRSLFRNKLMEEGFEIRKMVKEPNVERQRIKALYAKSAIQKKSGNILTIEGPTYFKDSAKYYENILSQPQEKEIVSRELLTSDSIAYAVNKTTAGLDFTDYLHITYTKAKEDNDYLSFFHLNRKPMFPVSVLTLINNKPVEILANGLYYDSMDLLSTGYWSWSEKIATMLPFDYWPAKK